MGEEVSTERSDGVTGRQSNTVTELRRSAASECLRSASLRLLAAVLAVGTTLLCFRPLAAQAANPNPPARLGSARTNNISAARPNSKTNLTAAIPRPNPPRTSLGPATPRTAGKTNAASVARGARASTNAPASKGSASSKSGAAIVETIRKVQANTTVKGSVGGGLLCLGLIFVFLARSRKGPLPSGLKLGCRVAGGLTTAGAVLSLAVVVLALQDFLNTSGLSVARQETVLAAILGQAVGAGVLLWLSVWLLLRSSKTSSEKPQAPAAPSPRPSLGGARFARSAKRAIHSCNVLQVNPESRQLWQFEAHGGGFALNRELTSFAGEKLPAGAAAKSWRSLFQRKLNVAWLPPTHVFVRVAQLPMSDFNETLAMVELQLEKLSPMPVAQVVWTIQVLPHARDKMQTVIVLIAGRNAVEEFLGQLEGQGYLADALEMPVLDQLQATPVTGDGAWIYPEAAGGKNMALVAWWYGGVLQNLDLVTLPPANRPASLKEQLLQMAWAGEIDGWLTSAPQWHLVADAPVAAEWEPALREGLEQPIEVLPPLSPSELAASTARRSSQAEPRANLLPVEFSTRYQQQFVDRLWMRGLGAVVALYLVGVAIYGVALGVLNYRTSGVQQEVVRLGPTYTNAIQLKARLQVLQERQDLKFAALDCWNVIAKLMPDSLTLDSMNFNEGRRLTLTGTAPSDQVSDINDFETAMRKYVDNGQPLFDPVGGTHFKYRSNPGGTTVTWDFSLDLKRTEAL